ncbi:MAG: zinc-binding protein [Deltaproteobacteria bacterium]|nr:zinc-binding protein [Deltaproteobacteria bacterium]
MRRETFGLSCQRSLSFFILGFFLLWMAAPSFAQSRPKLKIITTLFPLQEFAKAIGGEWVQADLLLPPGADPHNWEPKPSDVAKINRADIFIYCGRDMEPWVTDLLQATQSNNLRVLEVSRGMTLMEAKDHSHGTKPASSHGHGKKFDPHVWLDFSLAMNIVDRIASVISGKDPENTARYRASAEDYKAKLDILDQKYRASLSKCRHRQIILGGHSAFAYLAQRYGLKQIALYGVSPNAEPTPKKLAAVIQAVRNQGVRFIYFERLVNPKLAQVLAKEAGISTLALSDGANLTKAQLKNKTTFLDLMETNLENLRRGLECER